MFIIESASPTTTQLLFSRDFVQMFATQYRQRDFIKILKMMHYKKNIKLADGYLYILDFFKF